MRPKTLPQDSQTVQADSVMELPKVLRQCLICPITRKPLIYDKVHHRLISPSAELIFPIQHNIPLLVEELAEPYIRQGKS